MYDYRRPITEQGKPDAFDLRDRARVEGLASRVIPADGWAPDQTDPVAKVAAVLPEGVTVGRYSNCPNSRWGTHQATYRKDGTATDECAECHRRLAS